MKYIKLLTYITIVMGTFLTIYAKQPRQQRTSSQKIIITMIRDAVPISEIAKTRFQKRRPINFLEPRKDIVAYSSFKVKHTGPKLNVYASLIDKLPGINVYATSRIKASSNENKKAKTFSMVKLSQSPKIVVKGLTSMQGDLSIKYRFTGKAYEIRKLNKKNINIMMTIEKS